MMLILSWDRMTSATATTRAHSLCPTMRENASSNMVTGWSAAAAPTRGRA